MIDVLIPTYDRTARIERVARNITEATTVSHELVFVLEENDTASIAEVERLGLRAVINEDAPNYSGAVNTAIRHTDSQFVFAGADDLNFHPGWAEAALAHMDGWVMVVGTHDLLNPYVGAGIHATHYLVDRTYLEQIGGVLDRGPGSFLNDDYSHQFCDTEFIGTAKARCRFRPCFDSVVEHLHAMSGKGEPPDHTTAKTTARLAEDGALYDSRRPLWQDLSR